MGYCREHTAVNWDGQSYTAVTLHCRAWTCPECAERRKKQLCALAIAGKPNKFLTLTIRRVPGETPEDACKRLNKGWRLARFAIMRRLKIKSLPFLTVVERHKSGHPHLHILLRAGFIHWKLIRSLMLKYIQSPHIWITAINNSRQAAHYCAKYTTKCAEKVGNCKRYYHSRDYDLTPESEKWDKDFVIGTWEIRMVPIETIEEVWRLSNWQIIKEPRGVIHGLPPPSEVAARSRGQERGS